MRFYVEYKGQPICETEVYPEKVRSFTSPYKIKTSDQVDGITILNDGKTITTLRWITDGANTFFIIDKDGDAFPEKRCTITPTERIIESIEPSFKIEKRGPVEQDKSSVRGKPRR